MMEYVLEPSPRELNKRLNDAIFALTVKPNNDAMHWHQRLGHLNITDIRNLAEKQATGIDIAYGNISSADCIACIQGKQHKLPFKTGCTRALHIGELIHMDLAGPMETTSFDGKKYFLIIVDNYT